MLRIVFSVSIVLWFSVTSLADSATRMDAELLWKLGRLGAAALSRDGGELAYTVTRYDLAENSGTSTLYLKDLKTGAQRVLLKDWKSIGDLQFAPSPFGERIFVTGKQSKEGDAKPQAFAVNPQDGGMVQVTEAKDGIANLKVAPDGKRIAYTVDVKLDKEVKEIYEDLPKADARIIDSLLYRHWNQWHDYKYSHLHVDQLDESGRAVDQAVDLMHELKVDCPVPPFAGSENFAWSPDGQHIAYTMKIVNDWAQSTDSDVYLLNVANLVPDQPTEPKNITDGRNGYDNDPVFSPDGKYLAFHSMERPGFEADRNRVMIYDLASGTIREATQGLDQTAHAAKFSPDSNRLYFSSETQGTVQIFSIDQDGKNLRQVSRGNFDWDLLDIAADGQHALVSFMSMQRPAELAWLTLADGQTETVTSINDEPFSKLELPQVERRWVQATDGKKIHCWVIYPPDFDPSRKWPLILYCQGGPQGQVGQWFSYRWNFHLMAANGYVVLAPNRRGLPGFGQKWNDQISGDWGGQAMQDLLSATDVMLQEPYIDREKTAAVGASFGGYTAYWLMGHDQDRFKCMVAHCGVFNLESMYGATEELFFVDWDMGGPYWQSDALQAKYNAFSPHRFVRNWKTPLLVIHGEKDFRVPVTQGMEAFTAAQVKKVPSRFLYFPDEGHWVTSPQNSVLWHRVFFDWLDKYCK